jgi:hypothetical protein
MTERRPEVRASVTQGYLRVFREQTTATAERIESGVPGGTGPIDDMPRLSWLPLETHMQLLESAHVAVGDDRFRLSSRHATRQSFDAPPLTGLVQTAARLFQVSPAGLLRWAPRGWAASFRNAGSVEVDTGQQESTVRIQNFPQAHARSGTFAIGFAGTLEAILEYAVGHEPGASGVSPAGEVGILRDGTQGGPLEFRVRWASGE